MHFVTMYVNKQATMWNLYINIAVHYDNR